VVKAGAYTLTQISATSTQLEYYATDLDYLTDITQNLKYTNDMGLPKVTGSLTIPTFALEIDGAISDKTGSEGGT